MSHGHDIVIVIDIGQATDIARMVEEGNCVWKKVLNFIECVNCVYSAFPPIIIIIQ